MVTRDADHSEYLRTEQEQDQKLNFPHFYHLRKNSTSFTAAIGSENLSNNSVSPASGSNKKEEIIQSTNKNRRNGDKSNSFIFTRRGESVLNLSSENSSEDRSNRHMVFNRRSHRGGSKAAIKIGGERHTRSKRNMRKPNSYTQMDHLDIHQKQDRNSISDSDDSSHESNHLVPKLLKNDFTSYLNERNN